MSKKNKNENENQNPNENQNENVKVEVADKVAELEAKIAEQETQLAEQEAKIAELEDMKLRQMAEFDNFRRRTNKEKLDLMETAGEGIFKDMLPLVDDFERALEHEHSEGVQLIYQKFIGFLEQHQVKAMETVDADFNTDEHEAVTTFAAGEEKKGKVIDCTQKGYKLGEKVIRFAKVVVGE